MTRKKKSQVKEIEGEIRRVISDLEKIIQGVFEANQSTRAFRPTIFGISLDISLEPSDDEDAIDLEGLFDSEEPNVKGISLQDLMDIASIDTSDLEKLKARLQKCIEKSRKDVSSSDDFIDLGKLDISDDKSDDGTEGSTEGEDEMPTKSETGRIDIIKDASKIDKSHSFEVFKDHDKVSISAQFPGVKKEEFNIYVTGRAVEIEVSRGQKKIQKMVKMPVKIKPDKMRMSFQNGVLDMEFPRANPVRR